ncbi:MAG: prolyl oligopeptidase family serine peptidase [Bacteroidota bacterium]
MRIIFTLTIALNFLWALCNAQVKPSYLYNTSMPYGTLDIRTTISSTNYYYLQENKTFSYRESSPGVRTNTYLDMTSSWDSSPYKQGNLRRKNGSTDKFVMNYRFLLPLNYSSTYAEGYPMIVLLHGANERGNCLYENCYHATPAYDPNANVPPAPKTSTHKLLNNDHNLNQGGKTHLDARNKAAGKLPNDPTLVARAFPGFVLVPQMFNIWDSLNVQDAIRLIQLLAKKYNIDENRIYIHGLSIGGFATYQAIKRASWLFAAALPMSAVHDANIFKQNQQGKVAHVPIWIFQGGQDPNPTPAFTNTIVSKLRSAGAVVRYTLYSTLGHTIWNKAYAEPDFFSWMLSKTKSNIHLYKGIAVINTAQNQYPRLMLAEGFFAYQWERNGQLISGASSNTYTATSPGTYRARFSRVAAPTSSQWNKWSAPVTITSSSSARTDISKATDSMIIEKPVAVRQFLLDVFPNPTTTENLNISIQSPDEAPVKVQFIDPQGRVFYDTEFEANQISEGVRIAFPQNFTPGMYVIIAQQGKRLVRQKLVILK